MQITLPQALAAFDSLATRLHAPAAQAYAILYRQAVIDATLTLGTSFALCVLGLWTLRIWWPRMGDRWDDRPYLAVVGGNLSSTGVS